MATNTNRWRVVSNVPGQRTRTHFEGLEADARTYVQNNFPRAHVEPPSQEPGIPDVKLVGPGNKVEHYHSHLGWNAGDGHPPEVVDDDSADDEMADE
jgi:hypothetical protein